MSSSPANQQPSLAPTTWQWMALCAGLLGVMAFAVAHAPPAWQRPGPTAFWFSVVAGIVVGGIAVVNRVRSRWLVFVVAFLLISLSIVGMTGERYRLYVQSLRDLYLGPPSASTKLEAARHGNPLEEMLDEFRVRRREMYEAKEPFPVFLAFRLEALGLSDEPWPLRFWLGEIFLGGLIGAFVAVRWHSWRLETTRPQG